MPRFTWTLIAPWVGFAAASFLTAQDFRPPAYGENASPGYQTPPLNQENTAPGSSAVPSGELFEPGEILATVGDQFVLAADVVPHVNQILASNASRIPPEVLQQQRRMLIAQLTRSHVETKLLYLGFLRKVPADKVKDVHKRVETAFDEELDEERRKAEKMDKTQQEEMMKKNPQIGRIVLLMLEKGVWSQRELDGLLREYGGSLQQEKRFYVEHKLGRAVVSQNIKFQPDISYDDMLKYYREHEQDYAYPLRAKFEVITVRPANFPKPEEAYNALAALGNEVYYGANFAAVAKRSSQGLNSEKGGFHDWTPRGSLASKVLDESIFTLEPGKLSPILQDDRGYYILRVIERQEPGRVPLEQVQDEIKELVRKEKIQKQYEQFVKDTKKNIPVTTAFDNDPQLRQAVRPEDGIKR